MNVLLITKSDDNESVERVSRALAERGATPIRFDTDRFPTETGLALRWEEGAQRSQLVVDGSAFDLSTLASIWYRRIDVGARIPLDLEKGMRGPSVGESRATVLGAIATLDVFKLNDPNCVRRAEQKPLQLRLAQNVGLEIPRTLTTNDPDAVRAFAAQCPRGLVAKMLTSFAIVENDEERVVFTNRVRPEDLDDLEGLRLAPMTFQEEIPKKLELRATIVGDRCFTAAVDSQALDRAKLDWRREGAALVESWKPHALPRDVEARLFALADRLGLDYGAADLVLTPDARWVFLEINPSGEFLWLEPGAGLPLSAAIAEALVDPRRRRRGRALDR
jgi:glutathione synthase/RimK-type ligase-like ATP-grasp enzyme